MESVNEFDAQLRKAIDKYGEHRIDIAIEKNRVYGFYHSYDNSFGVTNDYTLEELGGIEALKEYEEEFDGLCVCVN